MPSRKKRPRDLVTRILLPLGLVAVSLVAVSPHVMAAGPIVNAGGFEGFTLNQPLNGQQGWLQAGSGGSATVQDVVTLSGKSVRVQRTATSDDRWGVPVTGFPTQRFVLVDWDMRVTPTGAADGLFGPYMAVDVFDSNPFIRVAGSLGVDATTGDVLFQVQDSGFLAETGTKASFNQWHHYRMLLDYTNHEYSVFFNGTFLAKTGFVDRGSGGANVNEFTDANIAATAAAGGPSNSLTATAYYDNFVVNDGVPGDFDIDADVDAADLGIWKSSFGLNAGGDATGDGKTDGADFLVWQRMRGTDLTPATPVVAAAPEPASAVMAVLAILGSASFARRRSAAGRAASTEASSAG